VDVSGCEDPVVVGLVSELPLSLKGWSIAEINNKHEPYLARNPLCFHPSLLSPIALFPIPSHVLSIHVDHEDQDSWHSPHAQDIFSDILVFSSRHLSGELQAVGSVSTLAGVAGSAGATNGIGTNSKFNRPYGVSISPDGLFALVADFYNHLIRQIILSTASVSTLAGVAGSAGATNAVGTNSKFNVPTRVSISPDGLFALVGDTFNHLIRRIVLSTIFPSSFPSASPTIPIVTFLSFGVKIGDEGMLISGKAILVDYLQDKRRGLLSFLLLLLLPHPPYLLLFQER
jgi:hypothetical protein